VKKVGKKAKIPVFLAKSTPHPPPPPYSPPLLFKDLLNCHFFIYLAWNQKSEHLGLAKLLPMAENIPCTPSLLSKLLCQSGRHLKTTSGRNENSKATKAACAAFAAWRIGQI